VASGKALLIVEWDKKGADGWYAGLAVGTERSEKSKRADATAEEISIGNATEGGRGAADAWLGEWLGVGPCSHAAPRQAGRSASGQQKNNCCCA
jgi:hypothetical protein